jgi:hypothetical protein
MKLSFVFVLFAVVVGLARAEDAVDLTKQDCATDNVCYIKVPGAECADGSATGFSVMYRRGARKLFLYLDGGGACWSKETCEKGTAAHLTATPYYEGPYFQQDPKNLEGWANFNNASNPVGDYSLARVPYCTGDIWMGNQTVDYGTPAKPYVVRHVGYRNLSLILKEIQKRFPDPDAIVFMGTSAGGLGVTFNLHQLRNAYPNNKVYVINDGGLPFKTPYVSAKGLGQLYKSWGTNITSPIPPAVLGTGENLATAIIDYNQKTFSDVPYGFVAAYKDWTMSFFARMLGAPNFTSAVRETMLALADGEFTHAPNYKVFYIEDFWHGYAAKDPGKVVSKGVKLSDWVTSMINDANTWDNVRPDQL